MGVIRSRLVRRGGAVVLTAGLCLAIAVPSATAVPAAGSTKASISLTGPGSATYGATVPLTGTAWRTGTSTKLVNATVWLQKAAHNTSGWVNLTSTRTDVDGRFTFNVKLNTPYDYRARYGGSPTYTVAVSPRIYPVVRQNVLFDSMKDTNWDTGALQVGGRIYPTPANNTQVWLQRYNPSTKTWSNYISGRTTGGNAFLIKGNVGGNVGTYRLVAPQHGYYATGYSRQVTYAHYKWRGAFRKPIAGKEGSGDWWYRVYTPEKSPDRTELELGTTPGGSAAVDVNTVGCKRIFVGALNYTNEYTPARETVGLLAGTSYLRGPWTLAAGQHNQGEATISNLAKARVQLKDLSGDTGDPLAYFVIWTLCSN